MFLDELGNRIREQREKLGLKQNDIAHALQISPQSVSKWERGENAPDITILPQLAKLLSVTTDWLLGRFSENQDLFEATVFVSSIHGAYKKSLTMDARDFASWANGIFYQLTEAVLKHDGVPIKYMGDQFLAFFSGTDHQKRSLQTALLSKKTINENLIIGLSSGEIFLGTVGHPDYSRPDIMGEVVNLAFLTMDWADTNTKSGIGATDSFVQYFDNTLSIGKKAEVNFKDIKNPVKVFEIKI